MLIRSYTIGSLKDIDLFSFLERVQFTLNSRMPPQKRKTVDALKKMRFTNTEVYVHYDFLRTVPRYLIMTDLGKKSMVLEIVDLIEYSFSQLNLKGIVIHMDTAFKKEMMADLTCNGYSDQSLERVCKRHIISPMYKTSGEVLDIVKANKPLGNSSFKSFEQEFLHNWYTSSVNQFYLDIKNECLSRGLDLTKPHARVFLENTTHILTGGLDPKNDCVAGSLKHNSLLTASKFDLLGVCWDLEHGFAADDVDITVGSLQQVLSVNKNLLIHLNCIEKGVTKGSMRDRHSLTTVFECSQYEVKYYEELIEMLGYYKIPYIREVKSETMEREMSQQSKLKS